MEREASMDRENDGELRRTVEPSDREELVGDTATSDRLTDRESVDPSAGRAGGQAEGRQGSAPETAGVEEHEPGP
jgi:hypothetical protein